MVRKTSFILLVVIGISGTALADNMDPILSNFYLKKYGAPDVERFKSYAEELGVVVSPKFLGPASTLGGYGFDLSWEISFTRINASSEYWKKGAAKPSQLAKTMQVHIQKGLPFSFQLEGIVSHVFESSMWGLSLGLKFSPIEGFKYIPDFALGAYVGTLLGCGDLALMNVSSVVMISKSFAVGGVITFIPYAGYKFLYVNASSYLSVARQGTSASTPGGTSPSSSLSDLFVIPRQNIYHSSGVLGLLLTGSHIVGGTEFSIGSATVYTFSFKLGFRL